MDIETQFHHECNSLHNYQKSIQFVLFIPTPMFSRTLE